MEWKTCYLKSDFDYQSIAGCSGYDQHKTRKELIRKEHRSLTGHIKAKICKSNRIWVDMMLLIRYGYAENVTRRSHSLQHDAIITDSSLLLNLEESYDLVRLELRGYRLSSAVLGNGITVNNGLSNSMNKQTIVVPPCCMVPFLPNSCLLHELVTLFSIFHLSSQKS